MLPKDCWSSHRGMIQVDGRVVYLEWLSGYLEVRERSGTLLFRGSNTELGIEQRELTIKGPYEDVREYIADRRGERKIVYVDLAFPIKGIKPKTMYGVIVRASKDFNIGPFGIGYTKLENIGSYITVYPPPGFLFEQIIVSQHKIAIFTLGRRRIYVMEEGGVRRIMLV
ncbi:MAG: hypothetical protein F7C81_05080 [Desulfurococcales archaeon]|nr:hypothetical protein [Desulfurococcales archaeon]